MHFNYFLPGRTRVSLEDLLELGLGYVFEPETVATSKTPFTPRPVTNGPGGQHGLIVSLSDEYCGYYKDRQVWKQEVDCDYWVGMWRDKPPTPETLARENLIPGQWLRLADGKSWMFPTARHWGEEDDRVVWECGLPARLTRDDTGRWISGDVKPRYQELWRLATGLLEAILGGSATQFSERDNLVIECFRCNYRVSAIEIDLLGVHDQQLRERAVEILLDLETLDTLLKKKLTTPDTGSSCAGPAALPPATATETTGQPAAT